MEIRYENLSKEKSLKLLSADREKGLSRQEAEKRLSQTGPNSIQSKKEKSPAAKFLAQFEDPLIFILLAAAVVSGFMGQFADCGIILVVVLLDGIVGYIQQARAEKAIDALKKLSSPKAVVRRDGQVMEVEARRLVPGDIVLLEAGRVVPADLRLIESANLKIEESALTGESAPAEKDSDFSARDEIPIGDRANMAHMSTSVTYGRGEGVVTATGMDTEIGKIAKILEDSDKEQTPLQKRLADLGKMLGVATIVICAMVFVVALFQHRNLFEMLLTAISLAVAAIPEGLPAVVTIVLAAGVSRMVKSRSIVRRLPAVETLGAVNYICTDKTGTLTQNRMTVTECRVGASLENGKQAAGETAELFFKGFALCSDATVENGREIGDPTETALVVMSAAHGFDKARTEKEWPRVDEIPFDSVRKMMTTKHDCGGKYISFTKGALDSLLKGVSHIRDGETIRPIRTDDIEKITAAASAMASDALRVLSLAYRTYDSADRKPEEKGLVFLGLAGMIDPPRPEAKDAVEQCRKAGVTTVMITGDHRDTAFAIAKDLGIAQSPEQAASGEEIDRMPPEELREAVKKLRVFARVSPQNKVQIVRALKANGNIVAMTGDGVNDAPSLKSADIGVAMGITGTDVAKGAADMVLTDDNFATIRLAIEEGRNIYDNIRKAVLYLLSSNFGEIITTFLAIALGWAAPLTPAQILWVNLITDSLPALALGADPGTHDVMSRPPRDPKESLFARGGYLNLLIYGIVIGGVTLAGFLVGFHTGGITEARTVAVTVLSVSQLFHAIGMRNEARSIFRMNHLENRGMIASFFIGFVLQILIVQFPPLCRIFSTHPLTLFHWALVLLFAAAPLIVHEILVWVRKGIEKTRIS